MFSKLHKISLGIIGFIFYLMVMILYLLSRNGSIVFVPGQLNSVTISDQNADSGISVSHVAFRNKSGGYIVFQQYLKTGSSPKIFSQYFQPGDYREVAVSFENQDDFLKDVFIPGTYVTAMLYEKEDLEQYHIQNWRFPLRDVFGNAVTAKFQVK